MSTRYASATRFTFEPVAEVTGLDVISQAYSTPAALRERLNSLALVSGLRATARAYLTHTSTAGKVKIRLTDGVRNALDVEMAMTGSPIVVDQPVDLSLFSPSAGLYWEVEVTEAGSAGAVGRLIADLTAETPLFVAVGGC